MRAQLREAALRQLRGADLNLTPGRYVVLASEREPLLDLVALLAGSEPTRQGLALLDGVSPVAHPQARKKIAALFADEELPPGKTVQSSVAKALAARGGSAAGAADVLATAGLARFADLAPSALGPRETRSVALALALSHDAAQLFALHEPLATLVPASVVLARLDEHTTRGAIVVSTTTSAADATTLGGQWLCVELGRLRALPGATPRLGAGPWQQVLVETNDARTLSRLLQESPHGLSTELGASPNSLKVMGPALDVTVQELLTLARQHGLELRRIEAAVPPVEALLAARAGFARGAYEASRLAALGPAAPAHEPPAAPEQRGAS
jgi:ABC-type nitrate/sulfonate/bicarbonate transport system ATPase subunit